MKIKGKKKVLKLADLKWDEKTYIRNGYSWQTAYDYSLAMKQGDLFPPIVVTQRRDNYLIVDGKHRSEALKLLKAEYADCIVLPEMNDEQLYVESIRLNIGHGRRLTSQEKLQIAVKLRDLGYAYDKISEIVRTPSDSLKKFLVKRTAYGDTGNTIVLKGATKHFSGATMNYDQEITNDVVQGLEQYRLVRDLNLLFKNRMVNWKDKKVVGELIQLKNYVNKYKTLETGA